MTNRIDTEYGYALLSINDEIEIDDEGEETTIGQYVMLDLFYVKPEFRGKGFGRKLVELAKVEAKKAGLEVKLAALPKEKCMSQPALVAFYESCGFTACGDQFSDAVIMEL